jgi:hypothetical protein
MAHAHMDWVNSDLRRGIRRQRDIALMIIILLIESELLSQEMF